MYITPASVHDVNGLDQVTYESGGYYVMDRGYIDFERLSIIDQYDTFFVIKAKDKLQFLRLSSIKSDKSTGVLCDQRIVFKGFYSNLSFEKEIRRVKYYDTEQDKTLVFLINKFTLPAQEIAML